MISWRISSKAYAPSAFTGEGARLHGGRWNSRGISMIYTASTRSLAMLEILVHIHPEIPYVFIPVEFDDALVETVPASQLHPHWTDEPPGLTSQAVGDAWARSRSSVVLAVPSAIIPEEKNYLLNPDHPRFTEMKIGKPEPCRFDPRLFR